MLLSSTCFRSWRALSKSAKSCVFVISSPVDCCGARGVAGTRHRRWVFAEPANLYLDQPELPDPSSLEHTQSDRALAIHPARCRGRPYAGRRACLSRGRNCRRGSWSPIREPPRAGEVYGTVQRRVHGPIPSPRRPGGARHRPLDVVRFKGVQRGLVLNRTNAVSLSAAWVTTRTAGSAAASSCTRPRCFFRAGRCPPAGYAWCRTAGPSNPHRRLLRTWIRTCPSEQAGGPAAASGRCDGLHGGRAAGGLSAGPWCDRLRKLYPLRGPGGRMTPGPRGPDTSFTYC